MLRMKIELMIIWKGYELGLCGGRERGRSLGGFHLKYGFGKGREKKYEFITRDFWLIGDVLIFRYLVERLEAFFHLETWLLFCITRKYLKRNRCFECFNCELAFVSVLFNYFWFNLKAAPDCTNKEMRVF